MASAEFDRWYRQYHARTADWLTDCGVKSADVVIVLPELVRLLLDKSATYPPLEAEARRIMDEIEYLPNSSLATISLIDDAIKAAQVLDTHLSDAEKQTASLSMSIDYLLTHQDEFSPRC
jgi:hypothetical protein